MTNDWKCCEKEPPRKLGEEILVRSKGSTFESYVRYTGIDYVREEIEGDGEICSILAEPLDLYEWRYV
jgi:hypothetical protein